MTFNPFPTRSPAFCTHWHMNDNFKRFLKPSKPCQVGIHWIALAEYSQMSTHVPGFQSFSGVFFCIFWIGQIRLGVKKAFQESWLKTLHGGCMFMIFILLSPSIHQHSITTKSLGLPNLHMSGWKIVFKILLALTVYLPCRHFHLPRHFVKQWLVTSGRTIKRKLGWGEADSTRSNGIWNSRLFQMWNLINLCINLLKLRGQNTQKQWNFCVSDTERLRVNTQE